MRDEKKEIILGKGTKIKKNNKSKMKGYKQIEENEAI